MAADQRRVFRFSQEEIDKINAVRGGYPFATFCRVELMDRVNWLYKKQTGQLPPKQATNAPAWQPASESRYHEDPTSNQA